MYSLFHQILVRPLPVPEPERLVNVEETGPKGGPRDCGAPGNCGFEQLFSYAMFRDLQARPNAFGGIAAHSGFRRTSPIGTIRHQRRVVSALFAT